MFNEFVSEFIKVNYNELRSVAEKNCNGTGFNTDDLLAELALYMYSNQEKIEDVLKNRQNKTRPLVRWCNTWMYNQLQYPPSKYGSNFTGKFSNIFRGEASEEMVGSCKEVDYEKIDIQDLTFDEQEKIVFIRSFLCKLNPFERKLYRMHFEDDLSHYKISTHFKNDGKKVSPSSIYLLIRELRQKIKDEYDNRNNRNN